MNNGSAMTKASVPAPEQNHKRRGRDSGILHVLQNFCQTTSLNGLGQVVSQPLYIVKCVWLIIFMVALGGNCFHLWTLGSQYGRFPVHESTSVSVYPVPFPDVTVCNLDAISVSNLEGFKSIPNTSLAEYVSLLHRLEAEGLWHHEKAEQAETAPYLLRNIGQNEAQQIGHKFKDFILDCKFKGESCDMETTFVPFFSPTMYNCFTFKGSEMSGEFMSSGSSTGLSLILYLEGTDGLTWGRSYYDPETSYGNSLGARVLVHPPGTYPMVDTEGFDIMPGQSTSVALEVVEVVRLPEPYGDCVDVQQMPEHPEFTQTHSSCLDMCRQYQTYQQCNCSSVYMPRPVNATLGNYCGAFQYSGSLQQMDNIYREETKCAHNVSLAFRERIEKQVDCKCFETCQNYEYDLFMSQSYWPAPKSYQEFFEHMVSHRPDRQELKAYAQFEHIMEDIEHQNENASHEEVWKLEEQAEHFKLNFARLNVYMKKLQVTKREQEPTYTMVTLVSNIGGTIGLWVGMSAISIAEVLQFLIKLSLALCRRGRN